MNNFDLLVDSLNSLNIEISNEQVDMFNKYYSILIEWNSFMNLTAITDLNDVIIKHFVDSVMLLNFVDINLKTIIDVGTGAGFPGIPLKIMCPDANIVLLDSLNKRIKFLNTVCDELKLKNISTIHGRAEDYAHNIKYREKFDFCVSRAVANLSTLSEYCIPFIKKGGMFISYKADNCNQEIANAKKAISTLNSNIVKTEKICLPNSDIERVFLFIEKKSLNNKIYPRKAGIPSKSPL